MAKRVDSDISRIAVSSPLPSRLMLPLPQPLRARNAGYFISRGKGSHPERVIDSYELIFVEQGRLGMQEEGATFDLQEGQTLLLFPGRRHGGTTPYPPELKFYWIHFYVDVSSNRRSRAKKKPTKRNAAQELQVPQIATLAEPERMAWWLRRFLDDQERGRLTPASASSLLLLILDEVASGGICHQATADTKTVLAQRAEEILRTRFHEPLTTSQLARELRYCPDHLARAYHATFGVSILTSLHRKRIAFAKKLLLSSDLNMNEVLRECGFHDPAQFRKLFRRHEGVTPGAYRKLFARTHVNTE